MNNNDALRLARVEAICNNLRVQMDDVQKQIYEEACENQNEELAAELVRTRRNKLLTESDASMCLDRCLPDVPDGESFGDWLPWLRSLGSVIANNWAVYRQALRDIPEQKGFPFAVTFPDKPE